eukprot:g10673.t1
MAPGGGSTAADDSIFDEDNEQSKPLLGEDYEKDVGGSGPVRPSKKLAEYLPVPAESLGVVHRLLRGLYGHLPREDVPRIIWLSLTLFSIIGGFWLLDSLKDTVLEGTVGLEVQPRAKLVSVAVTLLLVIQYNRLVDSCSKPTLFYILGACYTLLFLFISLILRSAPLGLANWGTRPERVVGWLSFVAIESYGSLAVALFWAFTNATVDLEAAKASYGLVIAGAQIGAIIGSTAATLPMHKADLHVWHLYAIGGLCPAVMALLVRGYVYIFGNHLPRERLTNVQGTVDSALNGLKLVLRHQYVALLFGISCLYEVVLTILDYQMKVLGVEMFRRTAGDEADEHMASLMGHFGQTTNSLSLLMSLFGTSLCVRLLGLRRTLRIFPTLLVVAVVTSFFAPSLSFLFVAVAILKGLTYALNEPCKEMLYLPTSDAIKFKAKGWIDVFGSRVAKGVGSFVTLSSRGDRRRLATYGGVASFLISLILLGISFVMGRHFEALIKSGEIVGDGEDGDDSGTPDLPHRAEPKAVGIELQSSATSDGQDEASLLGGDGGAGISGGRMEVLNINVGILGHVDSGKTSLVKALSTVLSTAALDKNPQSRDRGITLDLGFSSFTAVLPEHLPRDRYSHLQFTLVDCPGHASLIKTIIGGAQIMDMMLLVVDATKGMQAQTSECVVIGEAVMARGADVIVVLNKIDLIPEVERGERLRLAKEDVAAQLAGTKLSNASFVSCAAAVGGEKTASSQPYAPSQNSKGKTTKPARPSSERSKESVSGHDKGTPNARVGGGGTVAEPPQGDAAACEEASAIGVDAVALELSRRARVPARRASAPLYFAFDHCFSVRGQGTILTGTILTGEVKVNQLVELPTLRLQKKVKSMQMFRKPVSIARAGDRVGVCLASLDAKLLERGVVTTPGSVRPISAAIAVVRKVTAFTGQCVSGGYCHVSLGHTTVMATATFFGANELNKTSLALFEGNATDNKTGPAPKDHSARGQLSLDDVASLPFPWEAAFVQQAQLVDRANSVADDDDGQACEGMGDRLGALQYCHFAFHTPVIAPPSSVVLGSRLDNASSVANKAPAAYSHDGEGKGVATLEHCRIAFHGRLVMQASNADGGPRKGPGDVATALEFGAQAGQLKLYTEKLKTGVVFRIGADGQAGETVEVFGKDLFKKETNMSPFVGMVLLTEGGLVGHLESAFGKAGRFKARFPAGSSIKVGEKLILKFRKYFRDPSKHMHQAYLRETLEQQHHQSVHGERAPGNREDGSTPPPPPPPAATTSSGKAVAAAKESSEDLPPLREGIVDSVKESAADAEVDVAFISGLFAQEEDIRAIAKLGLAVRTEEGLAGHLKGPFGKLGKCKVEFSRGGDRRVQAGQRVFVPR